MDQSLINKVWEKTSLVEGFDSNMIRKDSCGALILKSEYGNHNSKFGWEIDHVYPLSKGGTDDPRNLRAMQWENNIAKGDDFPIYNGVVKAGGNDNIYEDTQFKINEKLLEELKELYHF